MISWAELPRSPGHAFHDALQKVLVESDFGAFVEEVCETFYVAKMGEPSIPRGRYFRIELCHDQRVVAVQRQASKT